MPLLSNKQHNEALPKLGCIICINGIRFGLAIKTVRVVFIFYNNDGY
jgi:hypothetical protein